MLRNVSQGDEPYQLVFAVDDENAPRAVAKHQLLGVLDGCVRQAAYRLLCHDPFDSRSLAIEALGADPKDDVAVGEDADGSPLLVTDR